jgi:hypothetical protein
MICPICGEKITLSSFRTVGDCRAIGSCGDAFIWPNATVGDPATINSGRLDTATWRVNEGGYRLKGCKRGYSRVNVGFRRKYIDPSF